MFGKWLSRITFFVVMTSVVYAGDRIVFDQNGSFSSVINKIQNSELNILAPNIGGETFTKSTDTVVYAMGLRKSALTSATWKSFKHSKVFIPNAFDLPALTQIEDQGNCGSCWAFSLTATHRDGHAMKGNDPGRLSQEWMVEHSPSSYGCDGGYFDSADDIVFPKGQPLWSACPYAEGSGKCAADLPAAASITTWFMLGDRANGPSVKDIEAYMATYGRPVSIDVAAGAGSWSSYKGGVYNACITAGTDHMINIVGWDNENEIFDKNGNLPPGKGVWVLRNSWGTSWGDRGYMRTKMTDSKGNKCNAVAENAAAFEFAK